MSTLLNPNFQHRDIAGYLEALSSGSPAPGGGSAAGLAGALGCSLGAMVCNLTLARNDNEFVRELRQVLLDLGRALLKAAEADERVFQSYRDATALPRTTEEEKSHRRAAIESALVAAADVPVEMVTLGLQALTALRDTAAVGTSHALGDLQTGGYLLQAMMLGSLENIGANVGLMKDVDNRERFDRAADSAREDLESAMQALNEAIAARAS
jgi:formiminotetrahydrofolate cyclodeaminase